MAVLKGVIEAAAGRVPVICGVAQPHLEVALQLQGICEPWPAQPTAALDDAATGRLRESLDRWGLLSTPRD